MLLACPSKSLIDHYQHAELSSEARNWSFNINLGGLFKG